MKKVPLSLILDLISIVALAVLLIGLVNYAKPCVHEDGSAAVCELTGMVLMGLGFAALVVLTVREFLMIRPAQIALSFVVVVLGALIAFLPGSVLPLCSDPTMACNVSMHPMAFIVGVLVALFALVTAVLFIKGVGIIKFEAGNERL